MEEKEGAKKAPSGKRKTATTVLAANNSDGGVV